MACLTRDLQKALCKYVEGHVPKSLRLSPEQLRNELINKGVCPSYVTSDQIAVIIEIAYH